MLQSAVTCLLWPAEHAIVYGLIDGKVMSAYFSKPEYYMNLSLHVCFIEYTIFCTVIEDTCHSSSTARPLIVLEFKVLYFLYVNLVTSNISHLIHVF